MFAGLINQAKSAVSGLLLQYVARASVAVPFIIGVGFAIAAISVMLVEHFGYAAGYWMMAGGLAAIGVVAAIVVGVKEHQEEVAEQKAEEVDTQQVVSDATAEALVQTPAALLGALFSVPGGAASALTAARVLGRNYPLVLLLVMIGALFWPTPASAVHSEPDGREPAAAGTYH